MSSRRKPTSDDFKRADEIAVELGWKKRKNCGAVDLTVGKFEITNCTVVPCKQGDPDYLAGVRVVGHGSTPS